MRRYVAVNHNGYGFGYKVGSTGMKVSYLALLSTMEFRRYVYFNPIFERYTS